MSTEEQHLEGTSLEWQLSQLAKAAPNAIDYCDAGYTGTNGDRPGLLRLINETQRGDKVRICKLDRLARNLRLLLEIEAKFRDIQVTLISITESIDTSTAFGRMVFQVLGSMAEWERESIIERTKSGRYARYREGKWGGGNTKYGYRYNPETKFLEIREDEASVVRLIYNLYVFDRLGNEQLARVINSDPNPKRTRRGNLWTSTTIGGILIHPGYKGEHPIGVKLPAIVDPKFWEQAQKRRHENPHLHRRRESPWLLQGIAKCGLEGYTLSCRVSHGRRRCYSCPGRKLKHYPDNSLRKRAYRELNQNPQLTAKQLSQMLGVNKRTIYQWKSRWKHKKARLDFTAQPPKEEAPQGEISSGYLFHQCKLPVMDAEWLEDKVFNMVWDTLSKPEGMGKAINDTIQILQARRSELETTVKPLQDRLADVDKQLIRLAEGWVVSALGDARVNEMRGKLEAERQRLSDLKAEVDPGQIDELAHVKEKLKLYENELDSIRAGKVDGAFYIMEDLPGIGKPLGSELTDGDVTKAKRAILDRFQTEVWIFPDRVEVKSTALVPVIPMGAQETVPARRNCFLPFPVKLVLEMKK